MRLAAFSLALLFASTAAAQQFGGPMAPQSTFTAATPFTAANGATTAATEVARVSQVLNVVADFGGTCDGTTDDTAAFNAAISTANATGHVIISIPGDATHPACKVAGALTPISAAYVGVAGSGPYAAQIVQTTDGVDTLTWSPTSPTTGQVYGGSLQNIWLRRTATTTSGAGLKLVQANGFFASNVDIRDFYTDIAIYGGSAINVSNFNLGSGLYFGSLRSGSSLIHAYAQALTSGYAWPSEVTFSNFDAKGANNYLDSALIVEGADGIWFTSGHLGFAATQQVYFHPTVNGVGIQSVSFGNVGIDGNGAGGIGVSIPALTVSGSFVRDVSVTGGEIEDVVGNAVDVREPSAELRLATDVRNSGGWAVYNYASSAIDVSGIINNAGASVSSTGAIYNGTIGIANFHDLILKNVTGSCLTMPTAIALSGPLRTVNIATDQSCATPPGQSLNYQMNGASQYASQPTGLAGGQYSLAGAEALAWGNSAVAAGYGSTAAGDTVSAAGYFSKVFGYTASDNDRYGAFVFGSGQNASLGDAQAARTVLRGSGSGTSAFRLTSDGQPARSGGNGGNCLNLWNYETALLEIKIVATDNQSFGNDFEYEMPAAKLAQGGAASSESYTAIGTAVTHSTGTGSTTSVAISADTTNGCLNVSFTPPSGNTDAWHAVATVDAVEAR